MSNTTFAPPLPDLLPFPSPAPEQQLSPFPPQPSPFPPHFPPHFPPQFPTHPHHLRSLRGGCYLLNYTPSGSPLVSYDGTLRVEAHAGGRTASGDLYQRRVVLLPHFPHHPLPHHPHQPRPPFRPRPVLAPPPSASAGIPILPREQYRYYVRVTQILEHFTFGNRFTLGLELWRFTKAAPEWSAGGTWTNEGPLTAQMSWQAAPSGFPSASDYLTGDVKNASGTVIGRLSMGWLSKYLRKATIEIDRVNQSEAPLDNGDGIDWKAVGDGIDWSLTVAHSDQSITEVSGDSWSDAECHAEMLARRDASDLDSQWRYYVLCVRRLDSTERGIMFDAFAGDSNNVPREGCAISSHWTIPNSEEWGATGGLRFGEVATAYFRTAVHETGHAFGLYHNTIDNGFMNTTNVIAESSLEPGSAPFPDNIQWSFEPEDARRLRHMPDIYVRPGGTPFGEDYAATPISPSDLKVAASGLELRVKPLTEAFPIGAPVRVDIELINRSEQVLFAPGNLKLKSGFVKGVVLDPANGRRTFSPLLRCVEDDPLLALAPGESITGSMTLLRGAQGALFPMPGLHRIRVEVSWEMQGIEATLEGEAAIMVTSAQSAEHAAAATRVLSTPDTLLALVLGGDHLEEGVAALQVALRDQVLRPHYAYIEAKRLGQRFQKRPPQLQEAAALLQDGTVMSQPEREKAALLLSPEAAREQPVKKREARRTGNNGDGKNLQGSA